MIRHRRELLSAALAAVLLLAAACGGGDQSDGEPAVAPESTAAGDDVRQAPRVAEDSDRVQVHYRGTLDDGEVFDSSRGREPLTFTVGAGDVISGFDDAVRGLAVGETVTVRLEPAEAYGERSDELIFDVPADQGPEGLSAGDRIRLSNGATATVLEIADGVVTIDANHALAGEALTFEIELVAVQ